MNSINDNRLIIELIGRKKEKRLLDQFFELYDLLFLMLGAYPVRENMICNGNEVDTSDWTRKYTTSSHYFIDLIFYAERLFLLVELLELEVNETMIQEYLYIMHDWIDEIVNNRKDRIKSKHYRMVEEVYQFNKMIEEIQNRV